MCVSVELRDWILFTPAQMSHEVRPFVEMIQNVGRSQGFDVPDPIV